MRWLRRKMRRWLNDDDVISVHRDFQLSSPSINSRGINFRVFQATGGMVVEAEMYDETKDRHHRDIYVITNEQDIGKELGKIITLQGLKI